MRYKAEYKPSELKCPVSGRWVSFDREAKPVLDTGVFGPLSGGVGGGLRYGLTAAGGDGGSREGGEGEREGRGAAAAGKVASNGGGGGGDGGGGGGDAVVAGGAPEASNPAPADDAAGSRVLALPADDLADDPADDSVDDSVDESVERVVLGLIAKQRLVECVALRLVAPALPAAAAGALRRRVGRWAAQCGPAAERILYLVDMDSVASGNDMFGSEVGAYTRPLFSST